MWERGREKKSKFNRNEENVKEGRAGKVFQICFIRLTPLNSTQHDPLEYWQMADCRLA